MDKPSGVAGAEFSIGLERIMTKKAGSEKQIYHLLTTNLLLVTLLIVHLKKMSPVSVKSFLADSELVHFRGISFILEFNVIAAVSYCKSTDTRCVLPI